MSCCWRTSQEAEITDCRRGEGREEAGIEREGVRGGNGWPGLKTSTYVINLHVVKWNGPI